MSEEGEQKKDPEFSSIMYDHSKALVEYGEKADKLLRSIQRNFENDYTSFCVGLGSLSIVGSVVLAAMDRSIAFAITLLVMGFIAVVAGIILRLQSSKTKISGLPEILEFEKEHTRVQLKERVYSRLWIKGRPEGLTDEQFNLLLTDSLAPDKND